MVVSQEIANGERWRAESQTNKTNDEMGPTFRFAYIFGITKISYIITWNGANTEYIVIAELFLVHHSTRLISCHCIRVPATSECTSDMEITHFYFLLVRYCRI